MALTPGTRLGAYEVLALLGAGGMGEVYRARDPKLNRDVAIKVLPESLIYDPERLTRFSREAKVLAALNHPNIAHIHGFEDSTGVPALVMELVDGPTLADRIAKGPIPLDEALPIAKQIAEALEAAHEKGIIHRDLKPANIKVRDDGTVKVLDFGLAKALDTTTVGNPNVTESPTITTPAMMTGIGIILGTAAYMSPEQAKGKPADRRTDVWAFGCVLYEMLTSTRAFPGEDVGDTLASILKSEPAWQLLSSNTPAAVGRLLRRCLQKDRHDRLQHMGDARLDLEDSLRSSSDTVVAPARVSGPMRLVAWLAAIVVAGTIGVAVGRSLRTSPDAPEMRVEITTPPTNRTASFALSPDGRKVVLSGEGPRGSQLWVRSLDALGLRPLAGTEAALYPFWSPDSRSIGFFANSRLKRLDLDGGPPQMLANVITPAGGTWNSAGTILYVPNDNAGVFRISETGGASSQVTPRRSPSLATRLPQFLPDGRHFLFFVARGDEPGVYIGELGNDIVRRLLAADTPALYTLGHVFFVREGSLFAQRLDPSTQELSGSVTRVGDDIAFGLNVPSFSVSAAGVIAYRTGAGQSRRRFVWFDRSGTQIGLVGEAGLLLSNPSLSPDGRHVVVQRSIQQNTDLWSLDLERDVFTRLTIDPGIDSLPLWSPDGRRIVFNSPRGTEGQLFLKRVDGSGPDEALRLPSGSGVRIACDWSSDGRFLLYKQLDAATSTMDLWVMPMDREGAGAPVPVVRTPYDERDGQFSPDGRWIAFESDESGQPEIYLQPFPGPGPKVRISTNGGSQVRWHANGHELFYIGSDTAFTAVRVNIVNDRPEVGTAVPLFKTHLAPIQAISRQQYVVTRDGQRFLIITADDTPVQPMTLVLNWKPVSQR